MRITRHIVTQEASDEHWQSEAFKAKVRCRASLVRRLIAASKQTARLAPLAVQKSRQASIQPDSQSIPVIPGLLFGQMGA